MMKWDIDVFLCSFAKGHVTVVTVVINVIGTIPKLFLQLFVVSCTHMHFETIRMQEDPSLCQVVACSDNTLGQ